MLLYFRVSLFPPNQSGSQQPHSHQVPTNLLLFLKTGPYRYRTKNSTEHIQDSPARKLVPPATPMARNIGRPNTIAAAASVLRAASFAANNDAAYFGYIFGI